MSRSPWLCMACYQGRRWCGKYHPHIEYSINYGKQPKKRGGKIV